MQKNHLLKEQLMGLENDNEIKQQNINALEQQLEFM